MIEWPCNPPRIEDLLHVQEKKAALEIQESGMYQYAAQFCGDLSANMDLLPRMLLTGYPVTPSSSPRIYHCYKDALKRLDCKEEYPLFMDFGYELEAHAVGSDENGYILMLNSACADILTDGELTALLGGELGHILLGHTRNYVLMDHMDIITKRIPMAGELIRNGLLGIFARWTAASGYSSDRAALFACESLKTLTSLRKKQMGMQDFPTEKILMQETSPMPGNLGLYYILSAGRVQIPGAVERIRELYRWVRTEEFRGKFPCLYYKLCLEREEEDISPEDKPLVRFHENAVNGGADELARLGEAYLFGGEGLPQIPISGRIFLSGAAVRGKERAMYLLGACMDTGVPDGKKRHADALRLYRAAASRGDSKAAAQLESAVSVKIPAAAADVCMQSARENQAAGETFWNSCSRAPDKKRLREAMDWFWVPLNEALIAAEFSEDICGCTGLILADGGIYGSLSPGREPFFISWEDYREQPLTQREEGKKEYFCCGEMPFYLCGKIAKGTMGALLVRIKAALNQK